MRNKNDKSYRERASVIVLDKKQRRFLMMYRKIEEKEKFVLMGGGIELGETPEEAAVREIKEESNLEIKLDKKLTEIKYKMCTDHVFLSTDFAGQIKLGGEESERIKENNIYSPKWIYIDELSRPDIPIYPEFIVKLIMQEFEN